MLYILLSKPNKVLLLLHLDNIVIFEREGILHLLSILDHSLHSATFQVIHVFDVGVRALFGVAHEDEVFGVLIAHGDLVDAVDPCHQRISMYVDMVEVLSEEAHESFEIIVGHSFDQKLLVVREEEETATLAHAFTRLLDSLVILSNIRIHTEFQVIILEAVKLSQVCKDIRCKLCANDLLVNHVMGVDLVDSLILFQKFRIVSDLAKECLHLLFDSFLLYMTLKHHFLIL